MDEKVMRDKMAELLAKISELPNGGGCAMQQEPDGSLQSSVEQLQDSLDHLRLSVKYLVFDLEATRRENTYLRRLVEQANRERHRGNDNESDDVFE